MVYKNKHDHKTQTTLSLTFSPEAPGFVTEERPGCKTC